MVIKCTFSFPLERMGDYDRLTMELPPLPEYIKRKGPFVDEALGDGNRLISIYEFDALRFAEAWKNISKQLDTFHGIPGFIFSARVLSKSDEVRNLRFA